MRTTHESSKNDITGDKQITKPSTDKYREGWDKIFTKKEEVKKKDKACPPESLCRCDHCE